MVREVLFVCTSNTCRSPMAEAFARQWLQRHGMLPAYTVRSRALTEEFDPEYSPASEYAVDCLRHEYSLDISSHRSKLLCHADVESAFAIIGVTARHHNILILNYPLSRGKLLRFSRDVEDPWRQEKAKYLRCARELYQLVPEVMERITSSQFR